MVMTEAADDPALRPPNAAAHRTTAMSSRESGRESPGGAAARKSRRESPATRLRQQPGSERAQA
jgi:hypothetical protein